MTSEGKAAKKKFPKPTQSHSNIDTNKTEEKNQKLRFFFEGSIFTRAKKILQDSLTWWCATPQTPHFFFF